MGLISGPELKSSEGSWDKDWRRTYGHTYLATYTTDCTEDYVRRTCGFAPMQFHPTDFATRVTDIRFKRFVDSIVTDNGTNEEAFLWQIDITFGFVDPLQALENGDPLSMRARPRFEPTEEEEIVGKDITDAPILNLAGVPYDPPVSRPRVRGVLTVLRNEPANFDFPTAWDYFNNRVNEASWNGFDAKTLRTQPIRLPEIQYSQEANIWYFPMEYTFLYDPDGHSKKLIESGILEVDPSDSTKRRPILVDGQPASDPQMLDSSGKALPLPVAPEDIVVTEWDIYETRDFTYFEMDDLFTMPPTPY